MCTEPADTGITGFAGESVDSKSGYRVWTGFWRAKSSRPQGRGAQRSRQNLVGLKWSLHTLLLPAQVQRWWAVSQSGRVTGSQGNQRGGKLVKWNKQISFGEVIFSDKTQDFPLLFKRWLQILLAVHLRQRERTESFRWDSKLYTDVLHQMDSCPF